MDALICQHFRYRQKDNGDLQVSYGGFKQAGASHGKYVAEAIKRLFAKGMIESKQGIPANPYMWRPNMYGITMYRENGGYIESANCNFVFVPVDVMESAAWCCLSINARRMLYRLLTENKRHKSEKNGQLLVSYIQFESHGVGARLIASALRELEAAGLLVITRGKQRGPIKEPNLYRLTFLGTINGPATWKPAHETNIIELPQKRKRNSKKKTINMPLKNYLSGNNDEVVPGNNHEVVKAPEPGNNHEVSYILSFPSTRTH